MENWHVTGWGKWSLIQATLSAIELLYEHADPDYFFLISGTDYPTSSPKNVEADLMGVGGDAFVDAFPVLEALRGDIFEPDPHLAHHREIHNLRLERDLHTFAARTKICADLDRLKLKLTKREHSLP